MAGAVVGAPTLADFQPLTADQIPAVIQPLEEALSAGVGPGTPTEVPLGTLCLLAASLLHYMEAANANSSSGEE